MRVYLDCFPCFVRQALEAAWMSTSDERVQRGILDEVMKRLIALPLEVTPPQVGQVIHRTVKALTRNGDPYGEVKRQYNEIALAMYPDLADRVRTSEDPLRTAVKLAIAGNIVDFGALSGSFDLDYVVEETLQSDFAVDDYGVFRRFLERATHIVYLGDNTGEIVFDRILVETLLGLGAFEVTFVVRGAPIINDATMEDARFAGLDRIVRVIPNGSDAPATVLSECSPEMVKVYRRADLVIVKGQGSYESLSEERGPLFFLLKAKCPMVARDLGVGVGGVILKGGRDVAGDV